MISTIDQKGTDMARLSTSSAFGNTGSTYDGKCNSASEKREAKAPENRHRKHSMDAYYRPRQRGMINVDNWDAEEMERDETPFS